MLSLAFVFIVCPAGLAQVPGQLDASALTHDKNINVHKAPHDITNGQGHARHGVFGVDSVVNFNLHYFADGVDFNGTPNREWYTNTVGNPPQMGGTTVINAPLQPINVELDDVNGNPQSIGGHPLISLATPFVAPTLGSPVFSDASYSSGTTPTQFSDAIQRAEFFNKMKPDWHTVLNPQAAAPVTMHFSQSATCDMSQPTGCNYYFALNGDGSCCLFILVDDDFPNFLFDTALGNAVNTAITGGVITTKDISTFLFPNVYLYFTNVNFCCVLGYHTYFFDPTTDPQQRWVLNYSSWITPGLFEGGLSDVSALSHEISESYNDPFVVSDGIHNLTPWWLSPNGNCQDVLETGDVIENLPDGLFPVTINNFTYHPQNEALIQWFQFESPSDALDGAYSYPNTSVLTMPSLPQNVNCTP
jgi:hypothetical protein